MTAPARYTPRDPRFAVTCEPCRFGRCEDCVHEMTIAEPSAIAGKYRCVCLCRAWRAS